VNTRRIDFRWQAFNLFNRTVFGAGITSFLADLSYETALSILPSYLSKLGSSTAVLGIIEGAADAPIAGRVVGWVPEAGLWAAFAAC
jgi:hypothetical protein